MIVNRSLLIWELSDTLNFIKEVTFFKSLSFLCLSNFLKKSFIAFRIFCILKGYILFKDSFLKLKLESKLKSRDLRNFKQKDVDENIYEKHVT